MFRARDSSAQKDFRHYASLKDNGGVYTREINRSRIADIDVGLTNFLTPGYIELSTR